VAASIRAVVARQLDEVDLVEDRNCSREVGQEDEARLQQRDQQQLAIRVVAGDLGAELTDAAAQLLRGEEDLADVGVGRYEARSSP
jgi:hypothetical protein